jgi:EH domain-containing protein 1
LEYRENYIESLREELVDLVAEKLTPLALQYGFTDVPLETTIKWKPVVLILGNYSSGKSTLINELLGCQVQTTGQAPTDDSFTVITGSDGDEKTSQVKITEERDGKVLLNDPQYPFEALKKHGQRFAAHFRLKKISSPFLNHLAIIDTPGMLDSVSEKDRGYNYQEVIGDLAQIADLVLVLFDPHKAGTVREAYTSLRETLPEKTFEDRVLFVLNRIDECASLVDLLRVYGTLCWNLSQMTGRKDIPMIHLTYSTDALKSQGTKPEFLNHLDNQREDLKKSILEAPKHRLDHLATFLETYSEQIGHLLEALLAYKKQALKARFKFLSFGGVASIAAAGAAYWYLINDVSSGSSERVIYGLTAGAAACAYTLWWVTFSGLSHKMFHSSQMSRLKYLTKLQTQSRKDSWKTVEPLLREKLQTSGGKFSAAEIRQQYKSTLNVSKKGSKEIRKALAELGTIKH